MCGSTTCVAVFYALARILAQIIVKIMDKRYRGPSEQIEGQIKEATDCLFLTRNISAAKKCRTTANCNAMLYAFLKRPTEIK